MCREGTALLYGGGPRRGSYGGAAAERRIGRDSPRGRQPRPLLLGRGRGTILHRLETPGSLGRGWGRDVGKGVACWLRKGEVVQGRSGREVKVKDIRGREVGKRGERGEVWERGEVMDSRGGESL